MRQIRIPRAGPPEILEVVEVPDLTPGAGQVRIAVEAAGVNFADVMARMGHYQDAPPFPVVVGYEVAGTIDAVGEGVDSARVGEPVVAMTQFGGYSEQVVVDTLQAVRRPEGMSAVQAAAIPVTGTTAWMILKVMGRVQAGDRVLVHSAGGGVGGMALGLLKEVGATAVGTASGHKHEALYAAGWDELVDYRTVDYAEALADGLGFDLVLDPIGGASWKKGLSLLRPGGRLVCYGLSDHAKNDRPSTWRFLKSVLAIPWLAANPVALIQENKGILGVNMGHLWDEGPRVLEWLEQVLERVQDGRMEARVHATVPFAEAAEAHAILHRRENLGKVVLVP